jgi:PAS domain S-box-containing protein
MNNAECKTILIVEDEAIISVVISKTVKRFGYNTICANSGEKSVELAASGEAIDLILMDIELGSGIDGTTAAQRILAIRDIPIVFHTSHSEREMVERVRGITRYGYVIKSSGDFVLQSSIEMAFELVEAHRKIKASEDHFYSMFEKAPLGYQSLDENGCFLEINQKWVETLGYSRDEVIGKWFGDFLAPEFVDAFRERFPMFKAAGKIHSEFQMIHKNGERRYISFEGRIGYEDDGSFKQTHCILSDETERKFSEDALVVSRMDLELIIKRMINAFVSFESVFNEQGEFVSYRFLYINDSYEQITGVKNDEVRGKTIHEVWPDTEDSWVKRYGEVAITGVTSSFEMYHDPTKKFYHCNVYRPGDSKNRFCVIFEDITGRKRSEEEIKSKNEELTSLNEELNATIEEIEAANEELTASNERLLESEREIERSEEKFRQMFFQHNAVMLLIDPVSGYIIDANSSAEAFYGYELSQLRRMKIQDINTLSPEEISVEMERAKERRINHFIFQHRLANSEIRTVEIYSSPVTINCNILLFSIIHDMTDRKKILDDLAASEEQFKSLAESSTDYIMVYDKEKKHTYANKATLQVSGKTWDEFIGKTHRDLGNPPELCELWEEKIEKVFNTGETQDAIFEWDGVNGRVYLDWRVTPIFSRDGNVDSVLGVSRDITDIKKAEDKLRESEERYSMALAAVDDGIWEWNVPDGNAFFSSQFYNMLGYADGDFAAFYDSWRQLVHPEDVDRVESGIRKSVESGIKFIIDYRMKMKSGQWLWVCSRGKAVEWDAEGKIVRMVGTLSDVTLRKNAELELRNSQGILKRIIANSSNLICEIDQKGRYTFLNDRYIDQLGYTPDELLGKSVADRMHPDDLAFAIAKYNALKSEAGISVDEWRFMHKNGNYIPFECRSSAYMDSDGQLKTVVISHDITDLKRIEDAQLFLIAGGSSLQGGEDFFQSLARYLAVSLGMDFVCIDRLVGGGLSAKTVAVYFDGKFEDNIEYALKDTPCGVVAGKTICTFPQDVRKLFPEDIILQEMIAESYAGVTLWSSTGEPIGLIAVIGRKKMENPHLAESILKMVAIRAAGELERRDAEEKIKSLLNEKEILLKEVHHRIKNNMNNIIGLLSLQADAVEDPADAGAIRDAMARVQSMMVLYDKLYRSDNFKEISIREYVSALTAEIIRNFSKSEFIKTSYNLEDFDLDIKILVPLGIIINELITNTMKYAFTGRKNGNINISASLKNNRAVVIIEDDGVGIPFSIDIDSTAGFGMQLIRMLTEQIGGRIRIERGKGARFVLEFPV